MSFLTQLLGMGIGIETKIDHQNGEPYTTVSRKPRLGRGFELQNPSAFNTKMTPEVWSRYRNEEKQAAEKATKKAAQNKKIEAEKTAKKNESSEKNIKNSKQQTTQNKTNQVSNLSFKSKN